MRADPGQFDSLELFRLCAENKNDSGLWSEFLRRFAGRIKTFIRGTLRQYLGSLPFVSDSLVLLDVTQETDLFQNTIMRLVENDCIAIKRFSGASEAELLVYLAVITRSTVRDYLRRLKARKRLPWQRLTVLQDFESTHRYSSDRTASEQAIERGILARELAELSLHVIKDHSGECSARDLLIFELHFSHDLSIGQIAECKGIGLSRTGVQKALNRLKDRVRIAVAAPSNPAVEQ